MMPGNSAFKAFCSHSKCVYFRMTEYSWDWMRWMSVLLLLLRFCWISCSWGRRKIILRWLRERLRMIYFWIGDSRCFLWSSPRRFRSTETPQTCWMSWLEGLGWIRFRVGQQCCLDLTLRRESETACWFRVQLRFAWIIEINITYSDCYFKIFIFHSSISWNCFPCFTSVFHSHPHSTLFVVFLRDLSLLVAAIAIVAITAPERGGKCSAGFRRARAGTGWGAATRRKKELESFRTVPGRNWGWSTARTQAGIFGTGYWRRGFPP